jgi:hypothetical protein
MGYQNWRLMMPIYKVEVKRYYIAEIDAYSADEACEYIENFKESDMILKDQDLEVLEVRAVTKDDL